MIAFPEIDDQSIAVLAIKDSGVRILFARYATTEAAKATITALAKFGLRAEIGDAVRVDIRPGAEVCSA